MITDFRFLFPPRPEEKVLPSSLADFDNGEWFAQAKLNGSCAVIGTNGIETQVRERRGKEFAYFKIKDSELLNLHTGNVGEWTIVCGEYLNKNKKYIDDKTFNIKFCVFDILVQGGNYLIGKSIEERMNLITDIYKTQEKDQWLSQLSDDIFVVNSHEMNFKELWDECVKVDLLEGLVIKKKSAKLKRCTKGTANKHFQLKSRKETKLYNF